MTINYDAESLSGWLGLPRLFLRYRGTIFAGTLKGPMFWIPNLLHVLVCFLGGQLYVSPKLTSSTNSVASSTTGGSVDIFSVNGEFQGLDLSGSSTKVCNKLALAHSTLFSPNWTSHDFSFSVLCVRSFPTHWP